MIEGLTRWPARIGLIVIALLLVACNAAGPSSNTPALGPALADDELFYRLGSGDKLRIIVFGEPELSGEFVVDGSGDINLPLIGAVRAADATIPQFQQRVVRGFNDGYINDPKVSIEVLNYRPFFIIGEVQNGGEYPYRAGLTVQDAVAVAGGYTHRANRSVAYIRRAGENEERRVTLEARIPVRPGDNIRIAERFF